MPQSPDLPLPSAAPLPAIVECLGRPPLVPGDNSAAYDTLLARVTGTVRPRDVLEEAWVRDVVDLLWEAVRLRRFKAALMTACADEGLQKLLTGLDVRGSTYELARRWAARALDAVGQVDAVLNGAGLGIEHVMARTLRQTIGEVERIDRMIASAEARRATTLREIERYRRPFGAAVRRAAQEADVEDAEFEDMPPPAAAPAQQSAEAVA
jgi:hypothetical protein